MSFRLPRLRDDIITEGNLASRWFRRIWQSLVEDIEANNTAIVTVLDALTGVDSSITGLQPQDDTLDALAALDSTAGLVEQTGADAFTKRAIGVGTAAAIPTRADCDTRYMKQGTVSASSATVTHSVPVNINGTTYYIILSNVP